MGRIGRNGTDVDKPGGTWTEAKAGRRALTNGFRRDAGNSGRDARAPRKQLRRPPSPFAEATADRKGGTPYLGEGAELNCVARRDLR